MIITVEPVVLFVADLEPAVAWYRIVLGVEPEVTLERTVVFCIGTVGELLLVYGESERHSGAAVLMCDDLDSALAAWRQWVGMVELECLGPEWPVRLVILRDPGDNCLVVLDVASNEAAAEGRQRLDRHILSGKGDGERKEQGSVHIFEDRKR